ncbi:MAG: helix-turn-helix domain-containing protein [Phycisphaerae bacterium]
MGTVPMVQSTLRALELLARAPITGSRDLARALGIAPTSAYRILRTLEESGWVGRQDDGSYGPGTGLLRIAQPLMALAHGLSRLRAQVELLGQQTGLTAVVTVREGDYAVTVDQVIPARRAGVTVPLGDRVSIIESFAGPCLLADMGEAGLRRLVRTAKARCWRGQSETEWRERIAAARRRGWCVDPGVFHDRIAVISAVVRDNEGKAVAAVSLLGLPGEFGLRTARRFQRPLMRTVRLAQIAGDTA